MACKMKPTLTVFTPTYNRVDLLARGYAAVLRQTSHDFCWLIIDDGSKDNTREVVRSWFDPASMKEEGDHIIGVSKDASWLQMHYCYKKNGGLHTGYNKAIELMDSEICVCIDSDDYLPDDGVEIILTEWPACKEKGLIGIIGRDYYLDGRVIGSPLPNVESACIIELSNRYHHVGDKKIVMRADLLKSVPPQPSFPGEKNFNPIYMILQIDKFGKYLLLEKNLCYVDYQETGMAANIFKQYVNSPNSFCALRCLHLTLDYTTWKYKLMNILHLSSSAIIAHDLSWLGKCKYPVLAYLSLPFGYILSLYVRKKSKTTISTNI